MQRVRLADAVAELDAVRVAGPAAVAVVLAGESVWQKTQCSMWNIGMCWWMTASKQRRVDAREHRGELFPVQVVAGHQPRAGRASEEELGGQLVGDVERVVADERQVRAFCAKEAEAGEVADEDGVGLGSRRSGGAGRLRRA